MKKDIISKNTGNSHGFMLLICVFISMFDADAAYVSLLLVQYLKMEILPFGVVNYFRFTILVVSNIIKIN